MRAALLDANAAVDNAHDAGASALPPETLTAFVERYWAAIRLRLAFHRQLPKLETETSRRGRAKRRPGHDLIDTLKTFKTETPRFMTDFDVPFTNNLAEQDLRMTKVKMKISGCFRTLEGAQIFASLKSVVSTARKQGANILQILAASPTQIRLTLTGWPTAWELRKNGEVQARVGFCSGIVANVKPCDNIACDINCTHE
jgi:transposase